MLQREILLLALFVCVIAGGGLLYFCCSRLGAREKKKFRNTSFTVREKELQEVLSSKPQSNGDGAKPSEKPKHVSTGEDFYAGKDSLSTHHQTNKRDDDDNNEALESMLWGAPSDDVEELIVGRNHIL